MSATALVHSTKLPSSAIKQSQRNVLTCKLNGVRNLKVFPVVADQQLRNRTRQGLIVHAAATDSKIKSSQPQSEESDLKHLSPDILSMFHETQKNMLELNKSRLKALEELKEARKTITELENKVQAYEKELVALRESANAPQVLVPATSGRAPVQQVAPAPQPVPVPQAAPPAAPAAPPPPAANAVTIKYYSGWDTAFLHYNMDNKGWTQVPGEKMGSEPDGAKVITVQGKRLEFVATNGKNDWDSPMGAGNYVIDGYGVYKLKSGKIEKLS